MGDTRTDPGHYYPGGRVRAKSGTAPQELIVQWSDVQGKPQIAPLPDRYRDGDVKEKVNEIASKFATAIAVALVGWTACAGLVVQKAPKGQVWNDEEIVMNVVYSAEAETDPTVGLTNGTIHIKGETITPLTSFAETDPTVPAWAKSDTPPLTMTTNTVADIANHAIATNAATTNLTARLAAKADAADTLSGYGITNAYTKTETEAKIVELAPAPGNYAAVSNAAMNAISAGYIAATNQQFCDAVLAVGIDTNVLAAVSWIASSTNAVAQIGDFYAALESIGITPAQGGMTLGGLLAAIVALLVWLKKNALTDGLTNGEPTDQKLHKFFKESNSILLDTIKANAGGEDEKTQTVFDELARMDAFTSTSTESDSFDIAITKLSQLLGENVAV